MTKTLVLISLFILLAMLNAIMDKIQFTPSKFWFGSWWIQQNWDRPKWQKYLLPMTVDGWHFVKFLFLSVLVAMLIILTGLLWYWWFVVMMLWGALFNIFYKL